MKQFIHIPSAKEKAVEAEVEDRERRKAISMGDNKEVEDKEIEVFSPSSYKH